MTLLRTSSVLRLFFISTLSLALLTFNLGSAEAQTMSNSNYKLKATILNSRQNTYTNTNEASIDTKQTEPNIYFGTNYKVVSSTAPFIFSISQTLIDYGALYPTNPVSRTNVLSVYNNYLFGYSVTAFENHGFYNQTSLSTIPDTTCDTGTCSDLNTGPWNNVLTYGFGYRCHNISDITACSNDFYDSDYYKHFPNISNSQSPQIVMAGTALGENKARITYKLNISGTQPIGFYSNTITFVATPNF